MSVVVADFRNKQPSIYSYFGRAGMGLLDNFINGMFQRDAEARDARKFSETLQGLQDAAAYQEGLPAQEAPPVSFGNTPGQGLFDSAEMGYKGGWKGNPELSDLVYRGPMPVTWPWKEKEEQAITTLPGILGDEQKLMDANSNTGRLWDYTQQGGQRHYGTTQDVYSALAKLKSVNPRHFSAIMGGLKNQLSNNENLLYQDTVAGRVGGLDYDVRNNPAGAMASGMTAQAYGLKPEGLMAYAYPNYEKGNFSAGDREVQYSFDPRTGSFSTQEYGYGIDPTKRYQSDADTEQANISAGAQRYVADRNYAGKWVPSYKEIYGPNGEVQAFNTKDGSVADTGAKSYLRGGGQSGNKPLTPQQKLSLGQAAVRSTEQMASPEEKWNYIVQMAQDDPTAVDVMARSVFTDGRLPVAAAEFYKTGNVRPSGQGGQPQAQGQPAAQSPASPVVAEARRRFPGETQGKSDEEIMRMLMQYK